jgi:hypothetical protein
LLNRTYFLSGGEVGSHFHAVALTAEVHCALLEIVVVDHLLIGVGHKVALGVMKVRRSLVHGVEHRFQILGLRHGHAAENTASPQLQ